MALNLKLSNAAANAEADALGSLCNSGYLRIYDGSQAADADTAVGAQVLLAELRFGVAAFAASSGGVIVANAITDDTSANATGTASWFRALKNDGSTVVMDGSVGASDANLNLNTTSVSSGAQVSVTALTHTVTKA